MFLYGRPDKTFIEECIETLTNYAAMIKVNQGNQGDDQIERLRKLVGEMETYWSLKGNKSSKEQFDKSLQRAALTGKAYQISEEQKLDVVKGLYLYASNMIYRQGTEAEEQVKQIQGMVRELADSWSMDREWADQICVILEAMAACPKQKIPEISRESHFFKDISAKAETLGFEVKGVKNGLLQLYREGDRVAQVDESGNVLYNPYPEVFKLLDEIEAWKEREESPHIQNEIQM